jgi:hypothetical protein
MASLSKLFHEIIALDTLPVGYPQQLYKSLTIGLAIRADMPSHTNAFIQPRFPE